MRQYRNPDLWLLDATSAACPTAVRVSAADRRRFDLDPLPPSPAPQQCHLQSPYSRSLHHRYASLRHDSRFSQALEAFGPDKTSLSGQQSACNWQHEELHKGEPQLARTSSTQSMRRPASALAARSLERLQSLQNRRQKSAHR